MSLKVIFKEKSHKMCYVITCLKIIIQIRHINLFDEFESDF